MITALIIIAAIILLLLILHLVMGKEMKIERSVFITKPVNEVFNYVKFTKNQDNFSVWNMADPNMKKDYEGTDGQVGFMYKWDSKNKNVGAGEQEIKSIDEAKRIEYEVRFLRPMKNVGKSEFLLDTVNPGQSKITWVFSCLTKFPMTVLKPVFQNMLAKDLEKALNNLKVILEK
jgi:uncharacterized protein YndB with AHSA1/START domain